MLILYTGGNTSFNGFPFLTSYVAGDSFLPRWLLKRGHRLVFSNAIILLTIVSVRAADHQGRGRQQPGAAVRHRRVHRFLHGRLRDGAYHSRAPDAGLAARLVINFSAGVLAVDRGGDLRGGEVHRGRLGGRASCSSILVPALIRLNREYTARDRGARDDQREPAAAPAALQPPHRLRLRGQLRPGHPGRAPVRAEHAAHHHPRGAFRHRQRPGRQAQGEVDPRRPRRHPRLHRRRRPPADPGGRRTGRAGSGRSRHARDGGAAPAELLGAARAAAARPHRGQDRRGGEPHPAIGRDHHPLRRREPRPGPAGTPGREGRGRADGLKRRADQVGPRGRRWRLSTARPRKPPAQGCTSAGARPGDGAKSQPEANGPVRRTNQASRRSARSPSRAGPPSKGGSAWWRSGRWNGTPCWPARSRTEPAT